MDPASPFYQRYRVQYDEDGTTFWVTPPRLRRMNPAHKRCIVAYHTEEYRCAAIHNTTHSDICLEIGCHAGITTRIISNRCLRVVGVDTSKHIIDVAKQKHPHLQFAVMDGNDLDSAAALLQGPNQGKTGSNFVMAGNTDSSQPSFLQQQQQQQQQQERGRHPTPYSPYSRVFVDISGQVPLIP
ncbi:hypothetical protein DUNSADRAFT_1541 [Dunaliella salina]|uniref:Methyltransferase domain-containing protein n=1 Tax=Dunaliella salina TaxID=3046 RepID=A0ABQ7FXB4_DUNSA|nr:hypothetical protein DUNSADRAFT_1541 [Dunaliella salina]|eukprot:KAF5826999.1 hypothetical protein DUNSADRAFT_1541 [Dunaliella salina]